MKDREHYFSSQPRTLKCLKMLALLSVFVVFNSCSEERTEAPKPVGPSQALIEKSARQWAMADLPVTSYKRGTTIVSTAGGILPENTTVFPVQIELGDSSNPKMGGMTVVLYFFEDEFEQWQFFEKDNPLRIRHMDVPPAR